MRGIARHPAGRARRATSAPPSRPLPRPSAARWCAISAATASAGCSTTRPTILHYGRRGEGVELKPGMFFTVEPMINLGRPHVKVLSDGWTAVTRDRSLSAQFEHTVGVTETGFEIFTALAARRLDQPPLLAQHDAARRGDCRRTAMPHYHRPPRPPARALRRGRRRRAARLRAARARALPGPSRAATPSRSPRRCSQRFGSFAEVLAAPAAAPDRDRRASARRRSPTSRSSTAAAQRLAKGAVSRAPGPRLLDGAARLLPRRHGLRGRASSSASSSSTSSNALIADEVQQRGTVDHTPVYPREVVKRALELSATAAHPRPQPSLRRPDAVARRHPA